MDGLWTPGVSNMIGLFDNDAVEIRFNVVQVGNLKMYGELVRMVTAVPIWRNRGGNRLTTRARMERVIGVVSDSGGFGALSAREQVLRGGWWDAKKSVD